MAAQSYAIVTINGTDIADPSMIYPYMACSNPLYLATPSWKPTGDTWINVLMGTISIVGVCLQILFADRIARAVHRKSYPFCCYCACIKIMGAQRLSVCDLGQYDVVMQKVRAHRIEDGLEECSGRIV
ncbi:hypothetical protein P280DRAFT_225910 [Massarina eburnea CBS 473.64]|uniref:Uncharacterized protein n=1 Tax=Massarina eburnea CBS 473.64 TaxID=1395130 RepID=A0A6A6SBK9_9PLEO|nr:hypothetical protein P280DRAFT_225910 [Massarina eburnea CBS 473.64]